MQNKTPLYNNGIHLFEGPTGAGKTLLMNIVARNLLKGDGFFLTSKDEFYHDRIKNFDLKEIFSKGKINYQLPNFLPELGHNKGVIFEEINWEFNRRMNKQTSYNEMFLPLIEFCVGHRHAKIPRVYFIGQDSDLQDTQLQSIIKYRHIIKSKKILLLFLEKRAFIN